jgi:hypothetical protein
MAGFVASEVGVHHQGTLWLRGGFLKSFIAGSDEDCFHYSVQSGAELELVTTIGGSRFGFEFKHSDKQELTKSMRPPFHGPRLFASPQFLLPGIV